MAVDDKESKEVEEEGDPEENDNYDWPNETQNNCSNRTKIDECGKVEAEDLDKPGSFGGEAVQENRCEADLEEYRDQASTNDDDECFDNISATESHVHFL